MCSGVRGPYGGLQVGICSVGSCVWVHLCVGTRRGVK